MAFALMRRVAGLALGVALVAASPARADDQLAATAAPVGSHTIAPPAGRFFQAKDGAEVTWDEVVRRARRAPVVYVGEKHDEPTDHALQLAVLSAVRSRNSAVVLGMEMFDRTQQPSLDRYMNRTTGEKEFLAESHYSERWGFPYDLYKPLLDFSRESGVRVAGLNVTQELVGKVRRLGIKGLELDDATQLPAIDLGDRVHRRRVLKAITGAHQHGAGGADSKAVLDRYYQAMCLWDEAMADGVLGEFLRDRSPALQVVVVAGRAHLEAGDGIPGRVRRRFPQASLIVLPAEGDDTPGEPLRFEDRPIADIVFFPEKKKGSPHGRWF